ncbi:hypothetical protein F2P81_024253 [Scophthalmus maximus]|uniref:SUEL-type lectin domain-containing protein n=1 Tax=Scophthalmus maximus TaxID=52904 RepID=A0A6A4RP08_SCOMX|nr:hypothetical protein F2P81_024253 [Scophthalmus maximus]
MFFSDGTLSAVGSALLVGVTWLSVLRDLAEGSSDFSDHNNTPNICYKFCTKMASCCTFPSDSCTKCSVRSLNVNLSTRKIFRRAAHSLCLSSSKDHNNTPNICYKFCTKMASCCTFPSDSCTKCSVRSLNVNLSTRKIFRRAAHSLCLSSSKGYLSKVLRNYTEQACEGDFLSVRCPPRTTVTVQSAFYGRRGASDPQQCPQAYQPLLSSYYAREDDRYCSVSTALQKMLDECQDRRSCQVLVNSRVFGTDQCPGSSKYLIVWYKCRPNEYKSKVVCEDERMRLSCKRGMQIAVYSAMFGRTQQGTLECPLHHRRAPSVDCQSSVALHVLTARCQGKKSCLVRASTRDFGDPCYSGTRKYLSVIYTCDKKRTRETNPNEEKSSDSERGGGESLLRPRGMNPVINSTSDGNMALISNALAAYTFISDHPERAALFFVCGVCLGLFLTLFALVVQISCRTDCQPRTQPPAKKKARPADSSSDSSDSDSDWDTTSDLSARRHRRFERTLNMNVFTSAEELERAQRLEERERIIREIWMNGQPDIPGTRSLNRYY